MNREIKFRGKRTDIDDWAYGDLLQNNDGSVGIRTNLHTWGDNNDDVDAFGDYLKVNPDSISQFTGLQDKNGKEIYEGDIITYSKETINGGIFPEKGFVKYRSDHAMFVLQTGTGDEILSYCRRHIEVIGNVIDNKELLED